MVSFSTPKNHAGRQASQLQELALPRDGSCSSVNPKARFQADKLNLEFERSNRICVGDGGS